MTSSGFDYLPAPSSLILAVAYFSDGPGRRCAIYQVRSETVIALACQAGNTDAIVTGYRALFEHETGCTKQDNSVSGKQFLITVLRSSRTIQIEADGYDAFRRPFVRLWVDGRPLETTMVRAGYGIRTTPRALRQPAVPTPLASSAQKTARAMPPARPPMQTVAGPAHEKWQPRPKRTLQTAAKRADPIVIRPPEPQHAFTEQDCG